MNERRTLHPSHMLLSIVAIIRGMVPLFLLLLLRGTKWSELEWYWYAGAGALLLLLSFVSFLQWKKFGFWLEEDRLVIREGLIFRQEKTIYYTRIHSVKVEQPLVHRLLGVAQLNIETPGGNKKADGILYALSLKEAGRIREQLRDFAEAGQSKSPLEEQTANVASAAGQATETDGAAFTAGINETAEYGFSAEGTAAATGTASNAEIAGAASAGSAGATGAAGTAVTAGIDTTSKEGDAVGGDGHVRFAGNDLRRSAKEQERGGRNETEITLDTVKLFQAAATSLNFGLVAAFFAGIYSFADDFIDQLLPDRFFEKVVTDSSSLMSGSLFIIFIALLVIGFAWVLSILLYILKYSGFAIRRDGGQISISYGLLEKKTFLFDPKHVQAVIVNESWLRQPFGYAEVKLQIVSSDKQEQLMLHPFLKFAEIQQLLNQFIPQMKLHPRGEMALSPKRALLYYIRIPLLFAVAACAGCIWYFGVAGMWSLPLLALVIWWRAGCHHSAGLLLRDGQLALRRRFIHRTTYYIRRPQIVTMKVNRSRAQRRKGLISVSVQALGSGFEYTVSCMEQRDVEPLWRWYSRHQSNEL